MSTTLKLFRRPCDNLPCTLCHELITESQEGCACTVPLKRLKRIAKRDKSEFVINWDISKAANYFHSDCLLPLMYPKSRRQQSSLPSQKISSAERSVLDTVEESIERFSTMEILHEQIQRLATLMQDALSIVAFTGAGISVSAGMMTYRGAEGIDTIAAFGDTNITTTSNNNKSEIVDLTGTRSKHNNNNNKSINKRKELPTSSSSTSTEPVITTTTTTIVEDNDTITTLKKSKTIHYETVEMIDPNTVLGDDGDIDYRLLQPTNTHQVLARLYNSNLLHYIATQNCDDLHYKSGIPATILSELHGNVFVEYCELCRQEYRRSFCVDLDSTDANPETNPNYECCPTCQWNHYTIRYCTNLQCPSISGTTAPAADLTKSTTKEGKDDVIVIDIEDESNNIQNAAKTTSTSSTIVIAKKTKGKKQQKGEKTNATNISSSVAVAPGGQKLHDTIVNFGDMLPEDILGGFVKAENAFKQADIALCLGSSLTVTRKEKCESICGLV